jgi:hypothetical protein
VILRSSKIELLLLDKTIKNFTPNISSIHRLARDIQDAMEPTLTPAAQRFIDEMDAGLLEGKVQASKLSSEDLQTIALLLKSRATARYF